MIPQVRAAYMRRIHSAIGFSPMMLTKFDDPIPLPLLGYMLPGLLAVAFFRGAYLFGCFASPHFPRHQHASRPRLYILGSSLK